MNLTTDSSHAKSHREGRIDTSSGIERRDDTEHIESPSSRPCSPSNQSQSEEGTKATAILSMPQKITIPDSDRSPPPSVSKSCSDQHSLPSPRAFHLEPLLDGVNDENTPHRIQNSLSNGTLGSSPINSITPRPIQYPSSQTRNNRQFPQSYLDGQPSSAYSDASSRDSANILTPGTHIRSSFYAKKRTPQREELTPQSAESPLSTNSFSSVPSPNPNQINTDRNRPTVLTMSDMAKFKCEHVGCTAPAFQTQYLLK